MRYTRLTENNREMIDYVFYKSNTQPEYENLECGYPWNDISVFSWNDLKIQIDSQLLKKPLNLKFSPFGRDNIPKTLNNNITFLSLFSLL